MEFDYVFYVGGAGGQFITGLLDRFVYNNNTSSIITGKNQYKHFTSNNIKGAHLPDIFEQDLSNIKKSVYVITDREFKATAYIKLLFDYKVEELGHSTNGVTRAKNLTMEEFDNKMECYHAIYDILQLTNFTTYDIDYIDFFVKQDVSLLQHIFKDTYTSEIRELIKEYHLKNIDFLSKLNKKHNANTLKLINTL
tara:strand:+ start:3573 stop:4157 length:585 start_codon:yes stop_codon:yes gene_type:complete